MTRKGKRATQQLMNNDYSHACNNNVGHTVDFSTYLSSRILLTLSLFSLLDKSFSFSKKEVGRRSKVPEIAARYPTLFLLFAETLLASSYKPFLSGTVSTIFIDKNIFSKQYEFAFALLVANGLQNKRLSSHPVVTITWLKSSG